MKNIKPHKIFFLCLLAVPVLLCAQFDHTELVTDTLDVERTTYSYFSDIRLGSADSLQLNFEAITENQYSDFKNGYSPTIDTNTNNISLTKNSFYLTAADTTFIFSCDSWKFCHRYHGYYPALNSYLIGVAGNEIYEIFLIERSTAKGLPVPPLFDASGANPLISPANNFMLIFGTCGYDRASCLKYESTLSAIALVDISEMKNLQDLDGRNFEILTSKDWYIDDVVWVDSNSIALKIYEDRSRNNDLINVRYFEAKIKTKNTGANKK